MSTFLAGLAVMLVLTVGTGLLLAVTGEPTVSRSAEMQSVHLDAGDHAVRR